MKPGSACHFLAAQAILTARGYARAHTPCRGQLRDAFHSHCTPSGSGLLTAYAGVQASFAVACRDIFGYACAPGAIYHCSHARVQNRAAGAARLCGGNRALSEHGGYSSAWDVLDQPSRFGLFPSAQIMHSSSLQPLPRAAIRAVIVGHTNGGCGCGCCCGGCSDPAAGASFAVDISGPVSLSPAVAPTNTVGLYTCLFTPLKSGAPLPDVSDSCDLQGHGLG